MTRAEFMASMRSQATEGGVRFDHDFTAGADWAERCGGEELVVRAHASGFYPTTYRVRCEDADVLVKWSEGAVVRRGVKLPPMWQMFNG